MNLKEYFELKPNQKRKIYNKKKARLKKKFRKMVKKNHEYKFSSKKFNDTFKYFDKLKMAFFIFIGVSIILIGINFEKIPLMADRGIYNEAFWINFVIHIHDMFLDYLLFSIILAFFLKRNEEQRRAQAYYDSIEDYRGRKEEEESSIKISSNIRRLNQMGYYEYNLSRCSLYSSNLRNLKFELTKFEGATLKETDFHSSTLKNCIFKGNNSKGVKLTNARFYDTKLINFWAEGIETSGTTFMRCDFECVNFSGAIFNSVSFKECRMKNVNFSNAILNNVNFKTVSGLNVQDIIHCASITKDSKFTDEIWTEIKKIKPEIIH